MIRGQRSKTLAARTEPSSAADGSRSRRGSRTRTRSRSGRLSTICPYSNYYNDLIRDLSREFEKKGVVFVGVNSGKLETVEEVRAHAHEHGHVFDIIKDPDSRIAELLDARRTPEAFLLDSRGTLRYHGRIASKISSPDLKSAIDAFLAGRPIRPAETKAFGCAIPRS